MNPTEEQKKAAEDVFYKVHNSSNPIDYIESIALLLASREQQAAENAARAIKAEAEQAALNSEWNAKSIMKAVVSAAAPFLNPKGE